MLEADRRFALRMIPYGVHVVTAIDAAGRPQAATVHWVTQTSFAPPLVTVALPADGLVYAAVRRTTRLRCTCWGVTTRPRRWRFAVRPAVLEDGRLSGWGFKASPATGLPLLDDAPAILELAVRAVLEFGDHHPVIAEVIGVHVRLPEQERPDEMVLHLRELGERAFYGG